MSSSLSSPPTTVRDLLPQQPVAGLGFLPDWHVNAGFITEDDVKVETVSTTFPPSIINRYIASTMLKYSDHPRYINIYGGGMK